MANSGYVLHKGIEQVFTSGPYAGSVVTSSYSNENGILGPIVNQNQSFTVGSVESLYPCVGLVFNRRVLDLINCFLDVAQPTVNSFTSNCFPYDGKFNFTYTPNGSSATIPYTIVEYGIDPTFAITSSVIINNAGTIPTTIDVHTLPSFPIQTTLVYFRAYNSGSTGFTSSYSPTLSSNCLPPLSCVTPNLQSVKLTSPGIVTVTWNIPPGGAPVTTITIQTSTNGSTWTNQTGTSTSSPRTLTAPTVITYYRIIAGCSLNSSIASNVITYTPARSIIFSPLNSEYIVLPTITTSSTQTEYSGGTFTIANGTYVVRNHAFKNKSYRSMTTTVYITGPNGKTQNSMEASFKSSDPTYAIYYSPNSLILGPGSYSFLLVASCGGILPGDSYDCLGGITSD